jgi:prepilin-type N-terminal cleavage/methylation domain-containing protein
MTAPNVTPCRRTFTLIELLVVIAIIAVLMGLLFPAIGLVMDNAKTTRAKSEMNSIIMAVKNYEATYGLLPWNSPAPPNDSSSFAAGGYQTITYATLIGILTGTNARKTVFLDPRADSANYKDPWNTDYVVLIDTNYDGEIRTPQALATRQKNIPSNTVLKGSVFVYSYGADKTAAGNDDITSWTD